MIRKATSRDLLQILDLTCRFSREYYGQEIDVSRSCASIKSIIKDGVCLVSDGGYIGGVLVQSLFHDQLSLVELGWYAEDNSGIRLLDAFVESGWEHGATEVRMTTLNTSPDIANKILVSRGFEVAETSYRLRPKE